MDKEILIQYCDMKEEIKDLRRRIHELEKQIDKIKEEGAVKDTVSGGMGGTQHFVVEGFPVPEYSRKMMLLRTRKAMLVEKISIHMPHAGHDITQSHLTGSEWISIHMPHAGHDSDCPKML